jgi:Ca2+:H+ antiporter
MSHWVWVVPLAALALLAAALGFGTNGVLIAVCAAALCGTVLASVHHAEVIAHRVGEPFGTLVLALAVTVIEASLILSVMLHGDADSATVPRDTIAAAIMIILTGVIGTCLLVGGIAHREQSFRTEGASPALAALIALAALSLVLPSFTTTTPGATYSNSQLLFAAAASLALWCIYVFFQTVRHREYFRGADDEASHGAIPSTKAAFSSFALLLVSLVAVVGLAKVLSPSVEAGVKVIGAPREVIGIVIAMVVLLPETLAAVRAARANRMQTSMNLAIGSALASIGLTIPVVAVASVLFNIPVVLGLSPKDLVLLSLTFLVSTLTLGSGRTTMMQGSVHLALFAAYLFLALVP